MAFARAGYNRDIDGTSRGAEFAGRTTSVFVGNLPYDCTEQRLIETFSTVGNVSNARLVFDHASGKMKGFGFVEFFDPDTASSAVRNLNGSDLDGRQLRVDHAEPDQKTMPARGGGGGGGGPAPAARSAPPSKPLLPAGIQLPPGTSAVDSISQTLATIPPAQLMEILSQMKGLVTQAPEKARELLNSQPQLAYALFQAMLMMKIVDGNILAQMVASNAGGGQPQQPPMQPAYQPPPQHYPQPTPAQPSYPQYAPPAPAQPAAPQPPSMANMSPEQRQILQAALALTPDQVMQLPDQQRQMVMDIRQQYGVR